MTQRNAPRRSRHRRQAIHALLLAWGVGSFSGCGRENPPPPAPTKPVAEAPAEKAKQDPPSEMPKETAAPAPTPAPVAPSDANGARPEGAPQAEAPPMPGSSSAFQKATRLQQRAQASRQAGRPREAYDGLSAAWEAIQTTAGEDPGAQALGQAILRELDEVSRELDAQNGGNAPRRSSSRPLISR